MVELANPHETLPCHLRPSPHPHAPDSRRSRSTAMWRSATVEVVRWGIQSSTLSWWETRQTCASTVAFDTCEKDGLRSWTCTTRCIRATLLGTREILFVKCRVFLSFSFVVAKSKSGLVMMKGSGGETDTHGHAKFCLYGAASCYA